MQRSASPVTTRSPVTLANRPSVIFESIKSVTPSFWSASRVADPSLPIDGSTRAMVSAASSVYLRASGVEMSGLDAPFFTPSANVRLASVVALSGSMLPEASASG